MHLRSPTKRGKPFWELLLSTRSTGFNMRCGHSIIFWLWRYFDSLNVFFIDGFWSVSSLQHLTGSTADTYLEYVQRNLPEGVSMKVVRHEVNSCSIWKWGLNCQTFTWHFWIHFSLWITHSNQVRPLPENLKAPASAESSWTKFKDIF